MWIFTKYGFYSAVCARQSDGRHGRPVDTQRIMVRSRVRKHLEALKERFAEQLGDCEVKEFAGTDYAYRIFTDKSVWSRVLEALSQEVDYDNFKSAVASYQGRMGVDYENALHDVWSVMNQLQK